MQKTNNQNKKYIKYPVGTKSCRLIFSEVKKWKEGNTYVKLFSKIRSKQK